MIEPQNLFNLYKNMGKSHAMTANQTAINTLIEQLRQQGFDEHQIKTDADSLGFWGKDWTKHFEPNASAIVSQNPPSNCKPSSSYVMSLTSSLPQAVDERVYPQGSCRQWRGGD